MEVDHCYFRTFFGLVVQETMNMNSIMIPSKYQYI